MSDRFAKRCDALRKNLRKNKVPTLLVQKETNVAWLTGFTGEDSLLLVTPGREILITDSRFVTQLTEECPDLELHVRKTRKKVETMDEAVSSVLKATELTQCGVEADQMTIGFKERIDEKIKTLQWINTRGAVEELRLIKDKLEIDEIRVAVKYAEDAFTKVCNSLNPDQTEKQVADAIEMHIRNQGGKGTSFVPIVAVGARSALPHGRASLEKIGSHGLLLIDWGATAAQYNSDLTRVIITGKISPKLERIYQVVLKAQTAAIKAIRPGAVTGDVDHVARKIIDDAGFGKYYGHGLGHGIGLNVHELPRLAPAMKQELQPGMVVTVEPGIYLPGIGGVRIEDDVLVTKSGHEVLSSLPKTLDESRLSWAG